MENKKDKGKTKRLIDRWAEDVAPIKILDKKAPKKEKKVKTKGKLI